MLLLLSSSTFGVDLVELLAYSFLEFRVVAGTYFEPLKALVGDPCHPCEFGHRDSHSSTLGSEGRSGVFSSGGVDQDGIDLVGDVVFQTADDVPVIEIFGSATLEVGHGTRVFVSHPKHDDLVDRRIGGPVVSPGVLRRRFE